MQPSVLKPSGDRPSSMRPKGRRPWRRSRPLKHGSSALVLQEPSKQPSCHWSNRLSGQVQPHGSKQLNRPEEIALKMMQALPVLQTSHLGRLKQRLAGQETQNADEG